MKNTKGFTLLELLVVVVIIGILAAIALPQYKMAAAKSKFATLKNMTKSLAQSVNRYYLVHDVYPECYTNLDLDFSVGASTFGKTFYPTGNISNCTYWTDNNQMAACYMYISKKLVGYYASYNGRSKICYTTSMDETHITNKLCQQETKQTNGHCSTTNYCTYNYH